MAIASDGYLSSLRALIADCLDASQICRSDV